MPDQRLNKQRLGGRELGESAAEQHQDEAVAEETTADSLDGATSHPRVSRGLVMFDVLVELPGA